MSVTRKDVSVWIIAVIWLAVNFTTWAVWGKEYLIFTNPICLLLITIFVFWVKGNKSRDAWFETEIKRKNSK